MKKISKLTKPALKAKWVEAFRSGKYKPGQGMLKRERDDGTTSFCCLGVLREISPAVKRRNGKEMMTLTNEALAYVGMDDKTQQHLIAMNDGLARPSFKGIATFIEKHL